MGTYHIFDQVSVQDVSDDACYLYNFLNDFGIEIRKKYIDRLENREISFRNLKQEWLDFLISRKFIYEGSLDQDYYSRQAASIEQKLNSTARFTLLPVQYACNFSCRYCYENHELKQRYGMDQIDEILRVIGNRECRWFSVEYFGGEPLLNVRWIRAFQEKLKDQEGFLPSSMTTNAYLLTGGLFSSLADLKILSYQITLDGTRESHAWLRPLASGAGTWDTILNNLKEIRRLDRQFRISLRVNFNSSNSSDEKMEEFFESIKFLENDQRFRLLFRPVGDYSSANGRSSDPDVLAQAGSLQEVQQSFESKALERGYVLADISMFTSAGGAVCYAAKKNSRVIGADGRLMKCTLAVDREINSIGSYKDASADEQKNRLWTFSKDKVREGCKSCVLFFQCLGISCPLKAMKPDSYRCLRYRIDESFLVQKIRKCKEILRTARLNSDK